MNILFVNYGDFTTNSLNHIGAFANTLCAQGHGCIVAVPDKKETVRHLTTPLFVPAVYEDLLARPNLFPNGKPADLIHAWTPREAVRKFILAYQRLTSTPAHVVVHLEDNEEHLVSSFTGHSIEELRNMDGIELDKLVRDGLPHPIRYRTFLRLADGITILVESLRDFTPRNVPVQLVPPGVDAALYKPQEPDPALRQELGLRVEEKVIVLTGSITFANEAEIRELYLAVALLNQRGVPTRLIRTGFNTPPFLQGLAFDQSCILDLGFVEKSRLPKLIALADVLVQPGHPGPFSDYRLPSKLPEFLACGKPVILPRANIAAQMTDGQDALFLDTGTPEEIADRCERIFNDAGLAQTLAQGARNFAQQHFDLGQNTRTLVSFYESTLALPSRAAWASIAGTQASDATLLLRELEKKARALTEKESSSEDVSDVANLAADLAALAIQLEGAGYEAEAEKLRKVTAKQREELTLSHQHIHNIEGLLVKKRRHQMASRELSRQHARNLEQALQSVRNALSASEGRLLLANKRGAELELHTRERLSAVTERLEQLKSELRQRDEKVRRMQQSFSWQITTPLRSLRRLFVDRTNAKRVAPLPSADPTQPPVPEALYPRVRYSYTYNFDHPRSWNTSSNKLLILGWCFENEGAPIKGIRARFGGKTIEGIYGSKRLDVLVSVGGKKQAEHCGVKLEMKTEIGDFPLFIEVQHEDGWQVYFETTVHVGKPGDPSELSEYEKWCEQHETLSSDDEAAIKDHISRLAKSSVISVVMPVYDPPETLFVKAIESVCAQLYPHWELCISDDASTQPHVREVIERYIGKDPRIKAVFRPQNGHISHASNSALEIATGEFVALFDHDDVLARTALYEVAAELQVSPDAQFIYTDEDKIDGEDRRFDPYFKPDWNPDLLHAQNYTSHLSVFRTDLIRSLGGFRVGFEGSQDWDLTLRAIEKIPVQAIRHIPKILYHWRAVPGSTALQLAEKSYPMDAARRALVEHFERKGQKIEMVPIPGDHWRIKYPLPAEPPLVSLVIPTRNAGKLLRQAVESILQKTRYPRYEIVIIDNGSDETATLSYFAQLRKTAARTDGKPVAVHILPYAKPFNYSAINNFAARQAAGSVIGLLNNDIEIINGDWLDEMVSQALRPGIGAVGAMLYYPLNTVQHAGVILGLGGVAGHPFKEFQRGDHGQKNRLRLVQNYSAVTAACMVIQKDRFWEVGGFNEQNLAVAFNDVDLCCKLLEAGYRNLWTPFAELYHHESATRGVEDTAEKKARFQSEVDYMMATWPELLTHDPAYNPNLTLVGEDFAPAYLPRTKKAWQTSTQSMLH